MIPTQKTKCASRAQMLGFAPDLRTWEGRKSQNRSGAFLSAHLACELRFYVRTWWPANSGLRLRSAQVGRSQVRT
jgi:hypothetical protein